MIEVKAPWLMPEMLIHNFIQKHSIWILKKLRQYASKKTILPELIYQTGEVITFFGKEYKLIVTENKLAKEPRIWFVKETFQVVIPPGLTDKQRISKLNKSFHFWFLHNSHAQFEERTTYWTKQMDVTYNRIRIKDVMSHWGSCSIRKNLNFNYRLAMLPQEMIDYVIVHELTHTKEMNHSVRFWAIVEEYIQNYKEIRKEMRKLRMSVD
jgi:predicted metal-dependent hydrolase